MKKLFIGALVLNLLIEGFAAFAMISDAGNMFPEGQAVAASWARIYGFAALAISSTVFWIWPNRDNIKAVGTVLGMLLTFHVAIFIALVTSSDQMAGTIIHAMMSVLFITLYFKRSKLCADLK
jgi:predicted Co/Zn/Cd cation transporter (cation efflux family)